MSRIEARSRIHLAGLLLAPVFIAAAASLFAGCSGGSDDPAEFRVLNVEIQDGETRQINRPIRVNFTRPVDPLTVNLNTFNVRRVGGGPAAGEFFLENDNRTIVFQPLCPTLDDLSDAGLASGTNPNNGGAPYEYEVNVIGVDENSQLPIRSVEGEGLVLSQTRTFKTPVVTTPLDLYIDTQVGPPKPLILGEPLPPRVQTIVDADPSITQDAIYCFLEVGGPQGTRHFFQRELNGSVSLVPPVTLPLNQFSDASSR
ncbi:MAG: hypothetical protein JNN27_13135, partial [Planctomycetes bacterium]|nr:hypothetical protein [Planctomycetota bacterium]